MNNDSCLQALIESQERMRAMVPGFTYNLGFSGKYFLNGDDLEDKGDTLLVGMTPTFFSALPFLLPVLRESILLFKYSLHQEVTLPAAPRSEKNFVPY